MKGALRDPRFWLWLALAAWPPEVLAWAFSWEIVDPAYLGVLLAWWPVDLGARLGALGIVLGAGAPLGRPYTLRPWGDALKAALSAEVLLGLKTTALALLGLMPAIALASYDLEGSRPWVLLLAGLGLIPAAHFGLHRLLALVWVLKEPLNGGQALEASARQTRGRFRLFLRLAGPWVALSLGLDALSLGVPEPWGLLTAPLSLAAGLLALQRADQGLA